EWVHVQLHQQKGMISLSPPTICNSASFDTTLQNNITLRARQANGLPLPFAATIFGPSGKEIGVVGQGSMMFISDASAPKATVKWSGGQCSVELSQEKTKETLCR
ncbi:FimD/PapC C-terminal domain-containing protein, partial [Klebsiella pneumoniae]|uniref:FimD/PapC C-terminal domain-containing protein n=1 Tax=Klebsiella pneumoniae TaxID=573 RepID=UPI002B1BDDCC